jgi:hypothetical protein
VRKIVPLLAAATALTIAAPASAITLLDVTNLPVQSVIPQSFTFTATSTSTKIDFQGYQVPGSLTLVNIFFAATGTFTPSKGRMFPPLEPVTSISKERARDCMTALRRQ